MGCELSLTFSMHPFCLTGSHKKPVAFSHQDVVGKGQPGLAMGDLVVPLKAAKNMICPSTNLA